MKLKILAIVGLAAVGVGAAFVAVGGLPASAAATTRYLTGAVATGDVTDEVAATGTVASSASYGAGVRARRPTSPARRGDSGPTTWTVDRRQGRGRRHRQEGRGPRDGRHDRPQAPAGRRDHRHRRRPRSSSRSPRSRPRRRRRRPTQIRQAKIGLYNAETQVSNAAQDAGRPADPDQARDADRPDRRHRHRPSTSSKGLDAPSGDAIVIDATTFQVTADVVESDIASMAVGQTATVTIARGGRDVTGTVTAIAPTAGRRLDRRRRVVRGDGHARRRAGDRPRRDDRRHHDHHRQRDGRPDRPGRRAARDDRRLHGPRSWAPTARRPPSPSRSAW